MADAVALVNSGREWLHAVLERTWEATARGPVSPHQRAELLLAALNATRRATEASQSVYTIAGGSANYRRSSLSGLAATSRPSPSMLAWLLSSTMRRGACCSDWTPCSRSYGCSVGSLAADSANVRSSSTSASRRKSI